MLSCGKPVLLRDGLLGRLVVEKVLGSILI